jgi:hypothetical protein
MLPKEVMGCCDQLDPVVKVEDCDGAPPIPPNNDDPMSFPHISTLLLGLLYRRPPVELLLPLALQVVLMECIRSMMSIIWSLVFPGPGESTC